MPLIKYSESQLYDTQEVCEDFFSGRISVPEATAMLRSMGIDFQRIKLELVNALMCQINEVAEAEAGKRRLESAKLRAYKRLNKNAIEQRRAMDLQKVRYKSTL